MTTTTLPGDPGPDRPTPADVSTAVAPDPAKPARPVEPTVLAAGGQPGTEAQAGAKPAAQPEPGQQAEPVDQAIPAELAEQPGGGGGWRPVRIVRGPDGDPAWARPALLVLLVATAVLYLWDLGASGYANSFYAAAAQAGSVSWKAWFFGSFDASNFITVDKPPAAMWMMGLSGRIFGFSSWSMLVPQALEGVAAVGVLYAAVRRWSGPAAGLLAAGILALTPAAALMFRFNNPDALLTLLLVVSAYCVVRALEHASTRWLLLAGAAIGFAFLAKMLQGFLVLPGFALVYLLAAPTTVWRRLGQLLAGGLAVVVAAGWWVAAVELWPAASRPYIGGSEHNSILELALGYTGLSRITGGSGGGPGGGRGGFGGGGAAGSSFGGSTGLNRLFGSEMGIEVSWLLPAALAALLLGLWVTRRGARTDRIRASLLLWGTWLLATGLVLSYMRGTVHPYYTIALAPSIAALVAIGSRELWRQRHTIDGRTGMAALVVAAGAWSVVLLGRNPDWHPALRHLLVAATAIVAVGLLAPPRWLRRGAVVLAAAGVVTAIAGTAAYAVATAGSPHSGSIPSAGPTGAAGVGGFGGFGGGRSGTRAPGGFPSGFPSGGNATGGGFPSAGPNQPGGTGSQGGPQGSGNAQVPATRRGGGNLPSGGASGLGGMPGFGGGGGGEGASTNSQLVAAL